MRIIGASIVILAGAIIIAGGAISEAIALRNSHYFNPSPVGFMLVVAASIWLLVELIGFSNLQAYLNHNPWNDKTQTQNRDVDND